MGCFLACFGDSKRRKQPRKSPVEIPPSNHVLTASEAVCALEQAEEVIEVPSIDLNKDSLEKLEEQIELCHTTEKASEPIIEDDKVVPSKEVENNLDEIKKEEKSGREEDAPRGSSNLSNSFSLPLNHRYAECPNSDDDDEYVEELDHLDDEEEEIKNKADADDGDGDAKSKLLIKQESSESLFSLSLGSRKQVCTVEAGENEVNSPDLSHQPDKVSLDKKTGCRNENVDSVLNPIENVTHCLSAAKVKTMPPVHHLEKENISLDEGCDVLISPEPTFRSMRKLKENHSDLKHVVDKIAVDTSLSNWLVESETTPKSKSSTSSIGNSPMWTRNSAKSYEDRPILGALTLESETTPKSKSSTSSIGNSPMWTRNSAKSYEDRPILGALTLEELRQFSAFSTPQRSRSRSPEEMPIIGTVGSYWSHTGQDADSNPGSSCRGSMKTARKSREDERVHWNSTPFLERLDMALASNSAEV